jgi:hypothetical protein
MAAARLSMRWKIRLEVSSSWKTLHSPQYLRLASCGLCEVRPQIRQVMALPPFRIS